MVTRFDIARRFHCHFGCFLIWIMVVSVSVGGEPTPDDSTDRMVRTAIRLDVEGDNDYAEMMLTSVLKKQPDHELARWRRGEFRIDGAWVSFNASASRYELPTWWEEYAAARETAGNDPEREFALAMWVRQHDRELSDIHFRHLLSHPRATEAMQSRVARLLNLRRVGSEWLDAEQLQALRETTMQANRNFDRWIRFLQPLREKVDQGTRKKREMALAKLRESLDESAIPAMESYLTPTSEAWGLWTVTHLDTMSSDTASQSLARHAIASNWPSVRASAVAKLKSRAIEDYVPSLIEMLESPIQTMFRVAAITTGMAEHRHLLVQEEMDELVTLEFAQRAVPANQMLSTTLATGMLTTQANQIEREVAVRNRQNAIVNERVHQVLSEVTQAYPREPTPEGWREWWREYTDYEMQNAKPIQRNYATRTVNYVAPNPAISSGSAIPSMSVVSAECFPAETEVWTHRGAIGIANVRVGDRVLSQDVRTGELAFQPVINTHTRSANLVRVHTDSLMFESTEGHPCWVNGSGWRMAKHLRGGDQLHALARPETVERLEYLPESEVYNLTVRGNANYFITASAILVHDNSYRESVAIITPGLASR